MRGTTSTRNAAGEAGVPTLGNLIAHVETHGLDRTRNHKGIAVEHSYSTYKQFAKDSAAEVAFAHLNEDGYASFVRTVGDPSWEQEAREDYRKERA